MLCRDDNVRSFEVNIEVGKLGGPFADGKFAEQLEDQIEDFVDSYY